MNNLITTIGFFVVSAAAFLSGWMWQKELSHRKGFNQGLHVNYLNKKLPDGTATIPEITFINTEGCNEYITKSQSLSIKSWTLEEERKNFDELYSKVKR